MRHTASFALLLLVSLALVACGSGGDDDGGGTEEGGGGSVTLRYTTFNNERSAIGRTATWYMDEVERRSDGRIEFDRHYSGSLLAPDDTLAGIRDGRADMGHLAGVFNPAELPLTQIAGVPFAAASGIASANAFDALYENNPAFREEYTKQGVTVLAFVPLGRIALGTKDPVHSLSDLKGKKIRSLGYSANATAAIAEPLVMAPADLYEALQRGVVDGFQLPLDIATLDFSLDEVAKHFTDPGIGSYAAVALLTISNDKWESIPADLRRVMTDVAAEIPAKSAEILAATEEEACAELRRSGGEITQLPPQEIEDWKAKTQEDAYAAWKSDAEKSGLSADELDSFREAYVDAVAEASESVDYVEAIATGCAS